MDTLLVSSLSRESDSIQSIGTGTEVGERGTFILCYYYHFLLSLLTILCDRGIWLGGEQHNFIPRPTDNVTVCLLARLSYYSRSSKLVY